MQEKRLEPPEQPDIELTANVKARELHFDEVPEAKVRFWGSPERDSASVNERRNLPEEVHEGVTYRNISVQLHIASKLGDIADGLWKKEAD